MAAPQTYNVKDRPANQVLAPHNGLAYAGVSITRPQEREAILRHIRDGDRVCEIGTFSGATARYIADNRPKCLVLAIDTFITFGGQNIVYALQNFRRAAAKNLHFFVGTSQSYFTLNPYSTFDKVLVDAGHAYPEAKKDLLIAERLCKPSSGSIIIAHDNDDKHPGVQKAVQEYLSSRRVELITQVLSVAFIPVL